MPKFNDASYFNFAAFYDHISNQAGLTNFAEVGAFAGASCAYLAKKLLERGKPFKLYAVDNWSNANDDLLLEGSVRETFTKRMERENLSQFVDVVWASSLDAAKQFTNQLDFVFLDADHSYEGVKADIRAWLPCLRENGILAGHDYGEPCGVKRAVDELLQPAIMGTCWYIKTPTVIKI